MWIRVGYFENFNGTDTILACSDCKGLQRLADQLRTLEDVNADPVNLRLLPFVQVHRGVELTAHPVDRGLGIRRTGPASCFAWHDSTEGWLESAEKIEGVARESRAGHCYLGATAAGDAVVMVSKGEYDEAWWERHGRDAPPCPRPTRSNNVAGVTVANRAFINAPLQLLAVLWASPYTLLGLFLGLFGICTG